MAPCISAWRAGALLIEACGRKTDLTKEQLKSALVRDLDTVLQIDLQEKVKAKP